MDAQRLILVAGGGLVALTAAGAWWQAVAGRRDRRRFPPPGAMITVDDHRLHMQVSGPHTAAPTVVLEAGLASMSANWAWVRNELARDCRVVTYDRAGLGWSEPGTGHLDAASSAAELHTALRAAGAAPPYVLAGHSYGGLVVRMFADRYRDEVAGLVLVDASHPRQWTYIPASRDGRTVAWGNRATALLARAGLLRLLRAERSYITGLPAQQYAEMRAYLARPEGWRVGADVLLAWARQSRDQVDAARHLGSLPLVVLSVTEQSRYGEVLTRLQTDLVPLSSSSRHITVAGATHYTLVSERAHAIVVSRAIRAVASAARSNRPMTRKADSAPAGLLRASQRRR
jgi:pimeloyl-ACP methyl ester carboxylesterase